MLTLQYVTDQKMGPFQRAFSNLKDAFACLGPDALIHRARAERASIGGSMTSGSDAMSDHPTLQFLAGAGGASLNRHS
ncbi:MAG: hypothetical protein P0119_05380 [Nitrospira sp.]|nr:hypothetical protein [Nitrospira sp.]